MKSKFRLISIVMVMLFSLLLAACAGAPSAVTPSAAPTIKPAPADALTLMAGTSIYTFWGDLTVAFVIGLLLVGGWYVFKRWNRERDESIRVNRLKMVLVAIGLMTAVFVLRAIPNAVVIVPADRVGVLLDFGSVVSGDAGRLDPGLHVVWPYRNQVALISTREYAYVTTDHVDTGSEDFLDYPVGARTCDGVDIKIPYTVKFKLSKENAQQFYIDYGSVVAAEERVVKVISRQKVRDVPTQFSSTAFYASSTVAEHPELIGDAELRELLKQAQCGNVGMGFDALNDQLSSELRDEFRKSGVELTYFGVKQADLQAYGKKLDEVRQAALDVRTAAQLALKAVQDKQTAITTAEGVALAKKATDTIDAEGQAQAAITNAKGQATAAVTTAQGKADALKITSEAEAAANLRVAVSLTPEYALYKQAMAYIAQWTGNVPMYQAGANNNPFMFLLPTAPITTTTAP